MWCLDTTVPLSAQCPLRSLMHRDMTFSNNGPAFIGDLVSTKEHFNEHVSCFRPVSSIEETLKKVILEEAASPLSILNTLQIDPKQLHIKSKLPPSAL